MYGNLYCPAADSRQQRKVTAYDLIRRMKRRYITSVIPRVANAIEEFDRTQYEKFFGENSVSDIYAQSAYENIPRMFSSSASLFKSRIIPLCILSRKR